MGKSMVSYFLTHGVLIWTIDVYSTVLQVPVTTFMLRRSIFSKNFDSQLIFDKLNSGFRDVRFSARSAVREFVSPPIFAHLCCAHLDWLLPSANQNTATRLLLAAVRKTPSLFAGVCFYPNFEVKDSSESAVSRKWHLELQNKKFSYRNRSRVSIRVTNILARGGGRRDRLQSPPNTVRLLGKIWFLFLIPRAHTQRVPRNFWHMGDMVS